MLKHALDNLLRLLADRRWVASRCRERTARPPTVLLERATGDAETFVVEVIRG